MDISAWLRSLGLEQYEPAFRENDIDAGVLPQLTAEDLSGLGVASIGHRRKLLAAVVSLNSAALLTRAAPAEHRPAAIYLAERRQLTVMFCDLVGSTALSSALDPEEMGDLIRAYQNPVTGEIMRYEGHIAKYLGDGVLAYFGWPRAHEDDAERAIRAGLDAARSVARLQAPTGAALAARTGIATGLVVVGDLVGAGRKLAKLEALLAPAAVELAQVVPWFASLLGIATGQGYSKPELTPAALKARTFDALLGHLSGLARRGPVLVLFEDLHWADPTTAELLAATIAASSPLLGRSSGRPGRTAITSRPSPSRVSAGGRARFCSGDWPGPRACPNWSRPKSWRRRTAFRFSSKS